MLARTDISRKAGRFFSAGLQANLVWRAPPTKRVLRQYATTQPPKALGNILADSIKASGPLSVSTFMRTCLLDPAQGYYATANTTSEESGKSRLRDILGTRGDFITSPEVSQVFGELLAIFNIARWQNLSLPDTPLRLIELGPGKGTLLADMIRTFSRFSKFFAGLREIHLVETSPGLMEMQHEAMERALHGTGKRLVAADKEDLSEDEIRVEWFPLVESVPIRNDSWSMLVAHEFFDALPTHIFERSQDGFREVLVDIERGGQSGITVLKPGDFTGSKAAPTNDSAVPPKFRYVLSPTPTPWSMLLAMRNPRFQGLQPGQRVEISPEAWAVSRRIGEIVSGRPATHVNPEMSEEDSKEKASQETARLEGPSKGGVGLVIDYGDEKAFGASFRAFKSHQIVDPLEKPGEADLTANVDFWHLKSALKGTDSRPLGIMYQNHFLQALGLGPRVEALLKAAQSEERKKDIDSAAKRLTDPSGMGAQYKVMGISAEATQGGSAEEVAKAKEPATKIYPFEM